MEPGLNGLTTCKVCIERLALNALLVAGFQAQGPSTELTVEEPGVRCNAGARCENQLGAGTTAHSPQHGGKFSLRLFASFCAVACFVGTELCAFHQSSAKECTKPLSWQVMSRHQH